MSIQVTPIPRLTTLTTPALTLGTTNTAGTAITAIASDSTLLVYDTTLPDAITYGQSGAVGSATTSARRDHAHAMAASDTVAAASAAEMLAASSTTVYASPGRTQNHPGVAKVWNNWNQTDSQSILESYNVASIADGGATGETDHTFTTDFGAGDTDYAVVGAGQQNYSIYTGGGGASKSVSVVSTITLLTTTAAAADRTENYMAIFGEQ